MFVNFLALVQADASGNGQQGGDMTSLGNPTLWGQLGGLNGLIIFALLVGFGVMLKLVMNHMQQDSAQKTEMLKDAMRASAEERDKIRKETERIHEQHLAAFHGVTDATVAAMKEHTSAIQALRTDLLQRNAGR